MARYYIDQSDVPSGAQIPASVNSTVAGVQSRALDIIRVIEGDGQIGVYSENHLGPFVGYAIKEAGEVRWEAAED